MDQVTVLSRTQRIVVAPDRSVTVVNAGPVGPPGPSAPGPPGPQGEVGPPGPSGDGAVSYRHVQSAAASTWTIVHNLGYRPGGIFVVDSAGEQQHGKVTHLDANSLTIQFFVNSSPASFSGEAELS